MGRGTSKDEAKEVESKVNGTGRVKNRSRHKQERMLRGNKDTANEF